jgi:predicted nuclease of predicted toxin-antitoxin system
MPVALYMDVHVPEAVALQLHHRDVDVLTAIEDGFRTNTDAEILERARRLERVLVTHDIGFKFLAEKWQREGRPFAGLVFAHQLQVTIGQLVTDLEVIATASEPEEWLNRVERLPL